MPQYAAIIKKPGRLKPGNRFMILFVGDTAPNRSLNMFIGNLCAWVNIF
jgi:hypothetical protein